MKKSLGLIIIILLMGVFRLSAQDTLPNWKALNFPLKKYGISIGNSHEFTGIRINFADKNVTRINGLNVTFWFKPFKNENAVVNGISLGIVPLAGSMRPLTIGLFGAGAANYLNGVSIGGLFFGSGGNINGLSISGLLTMADGRNSVISGIALSAIGVGAHKAINGLAVAGYGIGTDGDINGVASSLAYISAEKTFRGLAITAGYLKPKIFKGIAIAGYSNTNQMNGISIALYNRTKELHGVQLGLINRAENNPKGFKALPFVNLHP